MNDVDVLRSHRCCVKDRGRSAADDELDAGLDELGEQRFRLDDRRMFQR